LKAIAFSSEQAWRWNPNDRFSKQDAHNGHGIVTQSIQLVFVIEVQRQIANLEYIYFLDYKQETRHHAKHQQQMSMMIGDRQSRDRN